MTKIKNELICSYYGKPIASYEMFHHANNDIEIILYLPCARGTSLLSYNLTRSDVEVLDSKLTKNIGKFAGSQEVGLSLPTRSLRKIIPSERCDYLLAYGRACDLMNTVASILRCVYHDNTEEK